MLPTPWHSSNDREPFCVPSSNTSPENTLSPLSFQLLFVSLRSLRGPVVDLFTQLHYFIRAHAPLHSVVTSTPAPSYLVLGEDVCNMFTHPRHDRVGAAHLDPQTAEKGIQRACRLDNEFKRGVNPPRASGVPSPMSLEMVRPAIGKQIAHTMCAMGRDRTCWRHTSRYACQLVVPIRVRAPRPSPPPQY